MGESDYCLRGFTTGQDEGDFAQDIPTLYATTLEYLCDPLPEETSLLTGDSAVLMAILQQPLASHKAAVHPPTMHPNLVSTLRSLIDADALKDNESNIRTERDSNRRPEEEEDIATVPVDLIRNRRPFKCAHGGCNKTFKNPQTRKMHYKTHYSDDPGVCRAVGLEKSCSGSGSGTGTGRAGHNKKIPSRCPVCRRTFVGLYELRRHFGRKHSEGEKMHGCKKCGKRFYIEVDLRDHLKLCGEPIQCKCGMKFAFKCNLVAHKKTHPECLESSSSPSPSPPLDHYSSSLCNNQISSSSSTEGFPEMPFPPAGVMKVEDIHYSCCINGIW